MSSKDVVTNLLSLADVKVNGNRPWDMQVHNERVFDRILGEHSVGLGESYMDRDWDSVIWTNFFTKFFQPD